MQYWLVKSEPFKYSWNTFVKEGSTIWDGVRNYQARNSLQAMKIGDEVLFYHSNEGKEIVGIAKVIKEHYPDPTSNEQAWVVVELAPLKAFNRPIGLSEIKNDPNLKNIGLIKQMRLSVMPIDPKHFEYLVKMGEGK